MMPLYFGKFFKKEKIVLKAKKDNPVGGGA